MALQRQIEELKVKIVYAKLLYRIVMNSTCIHYEGSRPEYIHVQVLGNMHKTPYTTGKLQKIHIHIHLTRIIVNYLYNA